MRGAGVLALVLLLTAPAFADRDRKVAAAHFQEGSALYSDGKWAEALVEFEAGYDAYPLRGFLVNIGQCYRKLERLDEAADAWQRFLATHPSDARLRDEVTDALAEVESARAQRPRESTPAPIAPEPTTKIDPAPAELSSAPVAALELTAPPPPQLEKPKKRRWVWAVVSVTLVSVAAAAVTVGVVEWQASAPRAGSLGLIDGRR